MTQLLVLLMLPGVWIFSHVYILALIFHVDLFTLVSMIEQTFGIRSDTTFILVCFPVGIALAFFVGYFLDKVRTKRGMRLKLSARHGW
jgi:hypothetical protein